MSAESFRAGFVSIVGLPNAGKSTLLNRLIGEKIAITARQAQTTRTSIQGVLTEPNCQVVFTDTPGIHRSDNLFNKRMMSTVRSSLQDKDLIVFVADSNKAVTQEDEHALSAIPPEAKTLLVANKIDRIDDKRKLLPWIESYNKIFTFGDSIPVSARTGEGLDKLRAAIIQQMPLGPAVYPPEYLTDQPMRFLVAELLRERILHSAHDEVPHATAILIDEWEEKNTLTKISATIYVERPGQKTILIGNKGAMLKKIGSEARQNIEQLIDRKVFLSLFVKVKPNWREDPSFLNTVDWRSMIGSEDK